MTRVNVFDDGSAGSFLLKSELKKRNFEVNSIKVDNKNIVDWFTKVGHDQKTYLHFCYEDYIENHEHLRREIEKVERLGYRNDIVKEYEGLDRKTMLWRAKKAGYEEKSESFTEKPHISLPAPNPYGARIEPIFNKDGTVNVESVKEKVEGWKTIDPDTEMKEPDYLQRASESFGDKNETDKPNKKKRKLFKV